MKDINDTATVDLAGDFKRPRGRPASGTSQTPAERQKAYRERLRASGKQDLSVIVSADVAEALRKFVEFKDENLGQVVERILRDRLMRKR